MRALEPGPLLFLFALACGILVAAVLYTAFALLEYLLEVYRASRTSRARRRTFIP